MQAHHSATPIRRIAHLDMHVLKDIQDAEDAHLAVASGADAIVGATMVVAS